LEEAGALIERRPFMRLPFRLILDILREYYELHVPVVVFLPKLKEPFGERSTMTQRDYFGYFRLDRLRTVFTLFWSIRIVSEYDAPKPLRAYWFSKYVRCHKYMMPSPLLWGRETLNDPYQRPDRYLPRGLLSLDISDAEFSSGGVTHTVDDPDRLGVATGASPSFAEALARVVVFRGAGGISAPGTRLQYPDHADECLTHPLSSESVMICPDPMPREVVLWSHVLIDLVARYPVALQDFIAKARCAGSVVCVRRRRRSRRSPRYPMEPWRTKLIKYIIAHQARPVFTATDLAALKWDDTWADLMQI